MVVQFDSNLNKPSTKVVKRHRKSVVGGGHKIPCWFSARHGEGLIDGVPSDYLVESLTYNSIAPNLEKWAKI